MRGRSYVVAQDLPNASNGVFIFYIFIKAPACSLMAASPAHASSDVTSNAILTPPRTKGNCLIGVTGGQVICTHSRGTQNLLALLVLLPDTHSLVLCTLTIVVLW